MIRFDFYILGLAFLVLIIGLGIFFFNVLFKSKHFWVVNSVAWLIIAIFPVILIFSVFQENNDISGTLFGFSMSGSFAAFAFIWWKGIDFSLKHIDADQLKNENEQMGEELASLRALRKAQDDPRKILETETYQFYLKGDKDHKIALVTGDIQNVTLANIWVNSENTNMQMSRYYENSISGVIRYLGAKRNSLNYVTDDLIAKELSEKMGENLYVSVGTVLVTTSGELEKSHNISKIVHVASVQGQPGNGYSPMPNVSQCIHNVLSRIDEDSVFEEIQPKVLFPLMGTGKGGGSLEDAAAQLLSAAINYLKNNPKTRVQTIFFLTWTTLEREVCLKFLRKHTSIREEN